MSTSTLAPLAPISVAQKLAVASTGMKLDRTVPTYGTPSQRFACVELQQPNKRWHLTNNHN